VPITDENLVEEYLQGNDVAFERLLERNLNPVYVFIVRLTGNTEEAADLAQETFLKVWKSLKQFDQKQRFKTWVFAIARNTVFDYLRKKKLILFSELDTETQTFEEDIKDTALLPEELFAQNESKEHVERALMKLSPEYRSIVLLHAIDALTFEAIADITGKPMNTVKSQYRRALQQMRSSLEQDAPNGG
jgi:RNA polymerase sigma-70 factor (ECF subfamily)